MPQFSEISLERLNTCHSDLQNLFGEIIKYLDFAVLCGYRGEAEQEEAFRNGFSKVHFPHSKHNVVKSLAVDIAPYPIDWNNLERFKHLGFFVMGFSAAKGVQLIWGADWNKNYDLSDERFVDLPHFELVL